MADSPMLYVAILDTHHVFDSPYTYYKSMYVEWEPDLAVQSLAKKVRRLARASESEEFTFFKLEDPVVANSAKDFKEICNAAFPDYEHLSDIATPYDDEATLGKSNLPEVDKRSRIVALVALRIRPLPTSTSTRSVLASIDEDIYDREAIARLARRRPAPSTGAQSAELLASQVPDRLDAAYNHRPPELAPPPIAIYQPAFARFRREMAIPTEDIEFSQSELTQASHFVDVSLRLYPTENERQSALRDTCFVQGAPLWTSVRVDVNKTFVLPDGCYQLVGPNFHRVFPSLAELKNGSGEGSDPSDQAQAVYVSIVSSEQYSSIRRVSCCPAFLVSLSGHILSVWGAVFADRFFFERLALLYVGPQPPTSSPAGRSDMAVGIEEVAKMNRTLDNCLGDLIAYYTNLELSDTLAPNPSLNPSPAPSSGATNRIPKGRRSPHSIGTGNVRHDNQLATRFIHFTTFTFEGGDYHLVYGRPLTDYVNKTVFHASMKSSTQTADKPVIVKFAHHYSEAGHRLLAEAGLAPTLYHCEFEEAVGMWVVVMSYVEGDVSSRLEKGQGQALARAVDLLHANDLVFGDLRRPNVIATKPDSISLIDFEWCGPCHEVRDGDKVICRRVRYPSDISMGGRIDWAPGVGPKQVIMKEHDIYQLKKLSA